MIALVNRVCPTCKVNYALPRAVYESARSTGAAWFCPNGHRLQFPRKAQDGPPTPAGQGDSLEAENAVLRARIAALEADCTCALDLAEAENEERLRLQHRLTAAHNRARSLRQENRSGVCPWCHNKFDNLRRHLAAKHQGFIENQRNIA